MAQVKQISTGVIEENCYIIYEGQRAIIVDPGDETSKIKNTIEELEVSPVAIILTHTHFDHIGCVEDMRISYDIPVYVSPEEQEWLGDPTKNGSAFQSYEVIVTDADELFNPVQTLTIEGFTFDVVPTPGHSPGGVSFIFHDDAFVISGDALFAGSIGRTDLPGGNREQLLTGIQKYLFSLPEEYIVYPGHGRDTTIGQEQATNPYFK